MSDTASETSPFGPGYPHIDTCFKRDPKTNLIIPWEWTCGTFSYLADTPWEWTEKVDGTNIRIHYDPTETHENFKLTIAGRTDRAMLPKGIVAWFESSRSQLHTAFFNLFADEPYPVTIYGEGYGAGIQKGGAYGSIQEFIAFDILQGHRWLERSELLDACALAELDVVPGARRLTLREACIAIQTGSIESTWSKVKIEGLVGHPAEPLRDKYGRRISAKVKGVDWERWAQFNRSLA